MAGKSNIPDKVWDMARLIWENTPEISYAEVLDQLQMTFGDAAPKSKSTLTKKIRQGEWTKKAVVKTQKDPASDTRTEKVREQRPLDSKNDPGKNNREKKAANSIDARTIERGIEEISNNLIMSAEQRAKIIIKHRKSISKLGVLKDRVIDLALELMDTDFDMPDPIQIEGGEREDDAAANAVTKRMAVLDVTSQALARLTAAQKTTAEVEFPLCGISPDDFQQSEQQRRLDALETLDGIDDEERRMRDKLSQELHERLQIFEGWNADPDFGNDNDIEDAEFNEMDE